MIEGRPNETQCGAIEQNPAERWGKGRKRSDDVTASVVFTRERRLEWIAKDTEAWEWPGNSMIATAV